MSEHRPVRVRLEPLGETVEVERGALLQDRLFAYGVEFPCGGQGLCRGCRVRVSEGAARAHPDDEQVLTPAEIAEGWRLACRLQADTDITLEIEQWETVVLSDHSTFEFAPRDGLGMAIDLGTTTIVAQLLDLQTAHVLGVRSALNPQAAYGSDVMSRVEFALDGAGSDTLRRVAREKIGELAAGLAASRPLREVVIAGNTVMHHLFCGIDVEPLSHVPFHPVRDGMEMFRAKDLGWDLSGDPEVRFLPCLGGFVGSDILAGLLATKMAESEELIGLIDLGTNGEIVFGSRQRIVCASTAAGPAFEGGRISMGMRAATGAISEVRIEGGEHRCRVLGDGVPRGICGSGLVDAVAAGLDLGVILPSGRLAAPGPWPLAAPVALTQADVRELQLAKAAVAAGIRIVLRRLGAEPPDVSQLFLAGAFGNYVSRAGARRIGLIGFPDPLVQPAGNTALLGAKLALFREPSVGDYSSLRSRVEHISLAADPEFQEIYVEEMTFASTGG